MEKDFFAKRLLEIIMNFTNAPIKVHQEGEEREKFAHLLS
jgi:hypothetical protein